MAEIFIEPVTRLLDYAFNYKKNIENLKYEVEKLTDAKVNLQHSIEEAARRGEHTEEFVQNWLSNAQKACEDAERVINEGEELTNKSCWIGLCPNLKRRYVLSRKARKKVPVIAELQSDGIFERVSYVMYPPKFSPSSFPDGNYAFESRQSILMQVWDAIKDPNVSMIGVYGMGGVGKTTLVKEVSRRATESMLFDVSVMATLSYSPDLLKIQAEIAEQLGLQFVEESLAVRARRLHQRLKMEEKILVVLDDIWGRLDLEALGIPFGNDHLGCKILLASRSLDVLSHQMGAERNFRLEVLTLDESWSLFEKTIGGLGNPEFVYAAREIVQHLAGLPLMITATAKALKGKNLSVWKNASKEISKVDDGVQGKLFSALELSYNHLDDNEVRSLFLLCGLLGKSDIRIQDLLKYSIGLGLLYDTRTVDYARRRVHAMISELKSSCLLLDGEMNGFVKIHDLIQDFAVSIAYREQQVFTINNYIRLEVWPDEDALKSCTRISLPCLNVVKLPEVLESPNLEFLLLSTEEPSLRIPGSFFQGIPILKVLDFCGMSFSSLPPSLGCLEHLRTLCLDHCLLHDIAIIGELKKLEILTFAHSDIVELPREIGELSRLKLLDLSHCSKLNVFPANVLSRLCLLEELYMANSFVRWKIEGLMNQSNASLDELVLLSHLTSLEIQILDARILPRDLFTKKLQRYKILIGDEWDWNGHDETSRVLKLKLNTSIHSEYEVNQFLEGTDDLSLADARGVNSILYNLNSEGFPQLKRLIVQNCPEIHCLVNASESVPTVAFPLLKSLLLENLMNLEKFCHGELVGGSFSELRSIKVRSCNELKNLLSFSMVRFLMQLQEMEVIDCRNVMEIFKYEGADSDIEDKAAALTRLRSLTLERLPKLNSFCSIKEPLTIDPGLEEIVSESDYGPSVPLFQVPTLEDLILSSIPCETIWHGELSTACSHLKSLIVENCRDWKYLFTLSMIRSFIRLEKLEICNCEFMEGIIRTEEFSEEEGMIKLMFPRLNFLKLKNLSDVSSLRIGHGLIECPSLRHLELNRLNDLKNIWSRNIHFDPFLQNVEILKVQFCENLTNLAMPSASFQNLTCLEVLHCSKVINLVTSSVATSMVQLVTMHIEDCDMLTGIVADEKDETAGEIIFTKLKTLALVRLQNLTSFCLRGNTFNFPSLEEVTVAKCPKLRVFSPGITIASKLERVLIEFPSEDKWRWEGNLNATIEQMYSEMNI
eukprot:XP_025014740.1 probable disease resistance protein At4g27220 [Ricinus communis]